MKKKNETSGLFVAGVVAIVAMVALVLSNVSNLGGAATFGKEQVKAYQEICLDEDPENYFDVAGIVKLGPYEYSDYCQEDELTQYYCKTGKNLGATRPYLCPNGCSKGACK